MRKFVISSGHGNAVSGAVGIINEHTEAVRIVNRVYDILTKTYKVEGKKYHEKLAKNQALNLANIVNFHNRQARDLDISIHLNSGKPIATGSECLYYDAETLANKMSLAMSLALGIVNRGGKKRKELYFLRNTHKKAILLEVCFVSNPSDVQAYKKNFEKLCKAIAKVIAAELKE